MYLIIFTKHVNRVVIGNIKCQRKSPTSEEANKLAYYPNEQLFNANSLHLPHDNLRGNTKGI